MMAQSLLRKQRLLRFVANQTRFVPTITISKAQCLDNFIYETNQSIRLSFWQRHSELIRTYDVPQYDIGSIQFEGATYSNRKHGGKYTTIRFLRSMALREDNHKIIKCVPGPLDAIINSASKQKWIFLRIAQKPLIAPKFWERCSLIVCLKDVTDKRPKKTTKKEVKLDIELNLDKKIWQRMTTIERLNIFAWCKQFGEYVQKFKWNVYSTTSTSFYYEAIHYNACSQTAVRIAEREVKLGALTEAVKSSQQCTCCVPVMQYTPSIKPLRDLDLFLAHRQQPRTDKVLPIGHKCYLKALRASIAYKIKVEYMAWALSGAASASKGHHELFTDAQGGIWRIKSYTHGRYWYPSARYVADLNRCKETKIKYAHKNVAGGLRLLEDGEKPQWLLELWKLLPMLPPPDEINQIGYVLYQYSGVAEFSFGGINSHDEWYMFKDVWQLSVGRDSVLTIDGGGGDVNASIGIELPAGSIFHHDMQSYFQCASKVVGRGGKHSVSRRHCILKRGEFRLTILFRVCEDKALRAAVRHFKLCGNDDAYCKCLNKHLKLLNKHKKVKLKVKRKKQKIS